MTEKIKQIVSDYTKISPEQLFSETAIGRSTINSILLHRMYATIAKEVKVIEQYHEIETFGDLIQKISENTHHEEVTSYPRQTISGQVNSGNMHQGVGIDIEEISQMPRVNDFREDEFYKMNFAAGEISYCISQPDTYASFTGIFAAKEAIVKADNYYQSIAFNAIYIDHLPGGNPTHNGFRISISHTQTMAVAVAVTDPGNIFKDAADQEKMPIKGNLTYHFWLSIIAIILAVVAIFLSLF